MNNQTDSSFVFEDISSSSKTSKKFKQIEEIKKFPNNYVKHLDKIVKAISFIVAIAIVILTLGVAAVLILLDDIFTIVAIGVVILGVIVALVALFLIYALGHVITQNNKILERL